MNSIQNKMKFINWKNVSVGINIFLFTFLFAEAGRIGSYIRSIVPPVLIFSTALLFTSLLMMFFLTAISIMIYGTRRGWWLGTSFLGIIYSMWSLMIVLITRK